MSRVVEIDTKLFWRSTQSPSSGRWVATCEPMNLAMEADSLDEMYSLIEETLALVFSDLLEENELDQYLRERGWAAKNMPLRSQMEDVEFLVPFELIAEGKRDQARLAS